MRKTLLIVLTLSVSIKSDPSGLSALSTKILREYHFVKTLKTWAEAQSYCRETFTDLATVANEEDNGRLLSVLRARGKFAWIGLHDDLTTWKWMLGNADFNNDTDFSNWRPNEPNNKDSRQSCSMMTEHGFWRDVYCGNLRPAVCYYEQGPSTYILVQTAMNWFQARTYCRASYTDLVSVRNMSENNNIASLLSVNTWIGLRRKPWAYWSDQSPRTFTNWKTNQPDNDGNTMASCAAVNTTTGKWSDVDCKTKHFFICQNVSYPQRKTTLKLKFQSEANLNDPAVQQQILDQLHAKMEKHGIPDFKLRWIQTDGQTFHKEQKRKKEKGSGS